MRRRTTVSLFASYCLVLSFCLPLALAMDPVTITDQHPVASMAIDPRVLATGSPILEVDVTEVANPSLVPIGVAVSITAGNLKIPVGNFAFFPADHEGNFLLNSKAALAQVPRSSSRSSNARLVFELQKLRPSAPWKPVRVTIAAPKWRTQ
jgi:hypothetical protein